MRFYPFDKISAHKSGKPRAASTRKLPLHPADLPVMTSLSLSPIIKLCDKSILKSSAAFKSIPDFGLRQMQSRL